MLKRISLLLAILYIGFGQINTQVAFTVTQGWDSPLYFTLTNPQTQKSLGFSATGLFAATFNPFTPEQRINGQAQPQTIGQPISYALYVVIKGSKVYLRCSNGALGTYSSSSPIAANGGFNSYAIPKSNSFRLRCGGPNGNFLDRCLTFKTATPSLAACSVTDQFQIFNFEPQYYLPN